MPQIAVMNYGNCSIDIINISKETWDKYADDFDILIFDVMGYCKDEVYYMTGKDQIKTIYIDRDQL